MTNLNSIDNDWLNFCQGNYNSNINSNLNNKNNDTNNKPKSSDLYISTKTKISYLSNKIDLNKYFWKIPILQYSKDEEGIIKKQMKFNSQNKEELNIILEKLEVYKKKNFYIDEYIITNINNPEGRIKFKDVRKISIGINKKDLISYRCKKKSAFYNCFVVIIRIKLDNIFKEFHVKVFNTGKLEIPGIQDNSSLTKILDILTNTLNKLNIDDDIITYNKESETVLINSNFNSGFLIDRDKLYDILKNKYNINSSYDPCSYPGIQANFFYDTTLDKQTGIQPVTDILKNINNNIFKVSFMIFRTGSILIVGRCDETIINNIYLFIKDLLFEEYKNICINNTHVIFEKKSKNSALSSKKKKKIKIYSVYFNNIIKNN